MCVFLRLTLIVIVSLGSALVGFSQTDPLVRVLQTKGILTETEVRAITANASPEEQRNRLAALLRDKGVISATEFEAVRATPTSSEVKAIAADYKTSPPQPVLPEPQPAPTVIAAVAPVRLQGIDVPKREGLIPDIKLGTGARLKLTASSKPALFTIRHRRREMIFRCRCWLPILVRTTHRSFTCVHADYDWEQTSNG